MKYVDVVIPLNMSGTLTYGVPVAWQGLVQEGMRVEVSVGRNKLYAGLIWRIHDEQPEHYKVKPIKNIIDTDPIITGEQKVFWEWIAQYYMSTLGAVMQAALPNYFKLNNEALLVWSEHLEVPPLDLEGDIYIVAEALFIRKQLSIQEVRSLIPEANTSKVINEILESGMALVSEVLEERYKPKVEKAIVLSSQYEEENVLKQLFDDLEKNPKQLAVLIRYFELINNKKFVSTKEILSNKNISSSSLTTLISKGILIAQNETVDRIHIEIAPDEIDYELNSLQQSAKKEIHEAWEALNVCLLHGVTGSGKTLLYVDLIKEAIKNDEQVLLLLPEIALTTQIVARMTAYFGNSIGVYHSKYSNNERIEIWNKVKSKTIKIVMGARSALWLPFKDLKYIIIDEEHDTSYKQQDPAPRFHARDAGIYLAHLYGAKVLLGSATPSLESSYNVQIGKYHYVGIKERYRNVALPRVQVVPARNTQSNLSAILTTDMIKGIAENLKMGKQVILFQNKRGYAPFLICNFCGWVPQCKNCDVSLTYHKFSDKLHCHYCGNKSTPIKHCAQCGNHSISSKGFGTEKIEEDLQRIFPNHKVGRMDWDSVKGKNRYQTLLEEFTLGKIDILVGTHMIVKGLDFANVGLVGVLSADSLLSFPEFRVSERAFQVMSQVSGRAGRKDGEGEVIIQAYNLKNPVLQWVIHHDYKSFYQHEIVYRSNFNYPPFTKIIKIIGKHVTQNKIQDAMGILANMLSGIPQILIKGPAPAMISRVRNYYIEELWITIPREVKSINYIKREIAIAINNLNSTRGMSSIQITLDVDPN